MKVFLDNVPSLVIQETIVNQMPRMLCPESVFAMEPDLVRKIASDDAEARDIRDWIPYLQAGRSSEKLRCVSPLMV